MSGPGYLGTLVDTRPNSYYTQPHVDAGGGDPDDDLNLFYNGKFESAVRGVERWEFNRDPPDMLITRDTSAPLAGTGSMRVEIIDDSGGVGVSQQIRLVGDFPLQGETWRMSFLCKGETVSLMVWLSYTGASDVDQVLFVATPTAQTITTDITFSLTASRVDVFIMSNYHEPLQNGKTYWLDNIKLIKIADAP